MNNPLLMPHYTATVVYQDRITPAAPPILDAGGNPRRNAIGSRNY
jgi:hypothetical protein